MPSPITHQIGTIGAQQGFQQNNNIQAAARQAQVPHDSSQSAQASQAAAQRDTVKLRNSDRDKAIQAPQKRVESAFSPREGSAAKKEARTEAPVRKNTQDPNEPVDVVA